MSKIQFESKSQRGFNVFGFSSTCKQLCQRYNLKANHNYNNKTYDNENPVSNYVKDTI